MKTQLTRSTKPLTVFAMIFIVASSALLIHKAFAPPIFEDGLETGDLSKWNPVVGATVTSGNAHHGAYKAVLDAAGEYAQARFTGIDHAFMRAYVMFKAFPVSGAETTVLGVYNWAGSRYMADARVANVAGTMKWRLRFWNSTTHYTVTSDQHNPALDTWYCVEVEAISNTATNAESRLFIDGTELTDISQTGKNNTLPITCGYIWAATAHTRWYDCVVIDSAYIGPEDLIPPTFGTTSANTTVAGASCRFSCLVNDNANVSAYIFSTNNTGTWTNSTAAAFTSFANSTAAWANVTTTLNTTVGTVVSARWYANDTTDNWSSSPIVNLTTTAPQYYLTVTSPYATPSGEGWYPSGTTAYAGLDTDIVDHGNGTRHVFAAWSGDATGTDYAQSDPILMDGPKTATATWTTQYNLTVTATAGGTTDPAGPSWHNASTTVPVTALPDLNYVLNHWELDGTPVGAANPYDVLMDAPHTLHAIYDYNPPQYYLNVTTDPDSLTTIPGAGWYVEATEVELTAPAYVDIDAGTRYRFAYWTLDDTPQGDDVNPITVTMTANHTATAHYILQYYLTVTSPYDTPNPTSGWFDTGTPITATVTSPSAGPAGTRYVCTGWIGTGSVPATGTDPSAEFTLIEPSTLTWTWQTQHLLTVLTDPDSLTPQPTRDPTGEADLTSGWWYNDATSVTLTAQTVSEYRFTHWTIDDISQGDDVNPVNALMDAPHTATAHYTAIVHDIAVTDIVTSKSGCIPLPTVGEGYTAQINVTVTNLGETSETFNVTLYANASTIAWQQIALTPAETAILTFTWTTTGWTKGNYTLTATADPVPGETATDNNTLTHDALFLTLTGDVDGNHDVDIFDIVRMANAYAMTRPDPAYNPNADIDDDGDIDIFDIVAAAGHYGQTW